MSDLNEIDPIFLYPSEANGMHLISIRDSDDYLCTPEGNLIQSTSDELIEHLVLDLQRHSSVRVSDTKSLEGEPLEKISFYSLFSTQIDFWGDPERSIPRDEIISMLQRDPITNLSPGPEQVDQLHQWRSVIESLNDTQISFRDIQYFIEDKIEVQKLADLIKSDFDSSEGFKKAVFIQLSVLFNTPICAWSFVFKGLSENKLATALTQTADFVASVDMNIFEKLEERRPSGLNEEDAEKFDDENYLKVERTVRREMYEEIEAILRTSRQFLDLSTMPNPLKNLIEKGESKKLEFKETLSWDVRKEEKAKYIETSSLKTIAAFLNTEGGTLLVGVSDDGAIPGLKFEIEKLHHNSPDKFLLHFKNLVHTKIGAKYYTKLDWELQQINETLVLAVTVQPASEPCFLDDAFYVRTNPSTDQLTGEKQFKYMTERFRLKT